MSRYISIFVISLIIISFAACQTEQNGQTTTSVSAGLPLVRFSVDDFAGSGNCAICHTALTDDAGNDVSLDSHWRSTMMANAAKDPLWQAKVASEVARNPALQEVIESTCATCHMPMAYTQAETDGLPTLMLGEGFLNLDNTLNEVAMDGNSCTLCHQIVDPILGKFYIDTSTEPPDRLIYGPYADQAGGSMGAMVGFTPVQGLHIQDAELCATCHTVYTPYVDNEGNVAGTFPEQTPYLEWENSGFSPGMSCQICHMPAANGSVALTNQLSIASEYESFSQHYFIGGNSFMLKILKDHIEELAVTASTEQLEATLARLLNQLQNQSAGLSFTNTELADDKLTVELKIDNYAGHKFPTGFPSRRSWIQFSITDASGAVVFESGTPNADGSITGNNADESIDGYEPHYNIISQPDQVQIYESVMRDVDGMVTYTLLRGADYIKDNRLLPIMFDTENAIDDIAVHGAAISDDDFIGGADRITYQIDTSGYSGPFTITVRILYQSVSYQSMQDLLKGNDSLIERFADLYKDADKMPVQIAIISQTVS